MPRLKCTMHCGLLKMRNCHISTQNCAMIVARAAPRMPMCRGQMNIGESIALRMTVITDAIIAERGLDAARSMAFMPKNMCEITLPARVTTMYSRA